MHEKTITKKTPSSLRCVCPIADDANILRGFCFESGFKTSVRVTSTPSSRQVACEAGAKRRRGGGGGGKNKGIIKRLIRTGRPPKTNPKQTD